MLINRNNYESFFLLYADGELSAQEENTVEVFLAANEDLRTQLDMLFAAVLPAEEIMFPDKNKMFKEMPAAMALEEKMLLAIDNELSSSDDTSFLRDRELNAAYALLLLTKSDPSEIVPFPDKKSLYRRDKKAGNITGFIKGLIVALVLILIYIVVHFLLTPDKSKPVKEYNSLVADTAKNILLSDSVAKKLQQTGTNSTQEKVTQNKAAVRPNEIKKTGTTKDSASERGNILNDNIYPEESVKDSVAVNVITKPAEEKTVKENSSAPADPNKNIKKKKGFFRKVRDFIEEHIDDLDDATIIIEKSKKNPPAKPPSKTSPIKHPPVIEPVKPPDKSPPKTEESNLN